jgi:hypothetical protein
VLEEDVDGSGKVLLLVIRLWKYFNKPRAL